MKQLIMKYNIPAEDSDFGWENESLPIGNGYLGANIFGITERERVQITHNALVNPHYDEGRMFGGLNNFAELYFHFNHNDYENYERGLSLNDAVSYCRYLSDGAEFEREYFASYPDKVLVMKFKSSKNLSFDIKPIIPFIKEFALTEGDGGGKSGTIEIEDDKIILKGTLEFYNLHFEGQLKVISDGEFLKLSDGLKVKDATYATIIFAADTNYLLCENTFSEKDPKKKIPDTDPHESVCEIINNALKYDYNELKERHLKDYKNLFDRVSLSLGEADADFVPEMFKKYKNGESVPYLEELYFQYGRYLLISSSRKGGLPANLQGIWNCHEFSPWGSGFWHNINIQMNYWPAFNTNLLETFEPYIDFHDAYKPSAEKIASEYIKRNNPENYEEGDGECGWAIGTHAYPYTISAPGSHSGPGTGGLTSKLFWDYYEFMADKSVLKDITYPAILGMSKFLTKTVKNYDGEYLVLNSASPEQRNNGISIADGTYYQTVGCAFDQQFIYENGNDLLKCAELLGEDNRHVKLQREQIDKYSPIYIGWSGQIKEYWEENFYGEIGEYHHRHISHLMALYPGTLIKKSTPAWLDAAKYSLKERGNNTTGWALAHRLNAWSRTGDGNGAYEVIRKLLSEKTMFNLWDLHPPFQIDGNFGATSGIAEMLLQSHDDCVEILPALPDEWKTGSYSGLLARGGFEVSAEWENFNVHRIAVKSLKGNRLIIKYKNISKADGTQFDVLDNDMVELDTTEGGVYVFENIPPYEKVSEITSFEVNNLSELSWDSDMPVNIYRAFNSEPEYSLIAENVSGDSYVDEIDFSKYETVTYCIRKVCGNDESAGVCQTINHSTEKQRDSYYNKIKAYNKFTDEEMNKLKN